MKAGRATLPDEAYSVETLILTRDDVRAIAERVGLHALMDELIARLTAALRAYDGAATHIPARAGFSYEAPQPGLIEWMPAMGNGAVTLKIVGYHPRNPRLHNLPTIVSTISAYDTRTGHWLSVADGTLLTALRTGAASAVASRLLAKPDSRVVGLIGAGAQAVAQLHALSRVFDLEGAIIFDTDLEAAGTFRQRADFLRLEIGLAPAASLDFLVKSADILCTCTSVDIGQGPVFADGEVKPWLHINAVGSDFPGKFEVPLPLLKRSVVVPDFLEQAVKEGECQRLAPHEIGPAWVELVQQPERHAGLRDGLSVFDSTGWALEDMVVLELFTDYAQELGVGSRMAIESLAPDPRDPYYFIHNGHQPAEGAGPGYSRPGNGHDGLFVE